LSSDGCSSDLWGAWAARRGRAAAMLHGASGAGAALGSWAMAGSGSRKPALSPALPARVSCTGTAGPGKIAPDPDPARRRASLPELWRVLHALSRRLPLARIGRGRRRRRARGTAGALGRTPVVHARHPQRAGALGGAGRAHRRVLALHDPSAAAVGVPRGGGVVGIRPAQPPVRPGPDRAWPGAAHRRRLALARRRRQRR